MINQKGVAPILLIILIAVAIGGYFLYQKQTIPPVSISQLPVKDSPQDETVNWRTYTNKEYGFSFKYSNSLFGEGNTILVGEGNTILDSTTGSVIMLKSGDSNDNLNPLMINVAPRFFSTNLTLEEVSRANYEKNQTTAKEVISPLKKITLDNRPAYTYTILSTGFNGRWTGPAFKESAQKLERLVVIEAQNNHDYFQDDYFQIVYFDQTPFDTILSTFKFLNPDDLGHTSPDGSYLVIEPDVNLITIKDKQGQVIIDDLVTNNTKEIGYNTKFYCQCGTGFKNWVNNSQFTITVRNGAGEEYELLVNAPTGKVDESSFKRIE